MRRSLPLAIAGLAALASTSLLVPTVTTSAAEGDGFVTQIFSFTGAAATYTVPSHVCTLVVDVNGGSGGSTPTLADASTVVAGGLGAVAYGHLPVTPGEVLDVVVGGAGGSPSGTISPSRVPGRSADVVVPSPGAGGFNGGGDGGSSQSSFSAGGGGGGGASQISHAGQPLVVAPGGGGAGAYGGNPGGQGGDGAQVAGGIGISGGAAGGTSGDQGGAGGLGTGSGGGDGGAGSSGQGGVGGTAAGPWAAGGGGGGGYLGGGGGGASGAGATAGGAGGGGGRGFQTMGGTITVRPDAGDGVVTITAFPPDPVGCADPVTTVPPAPPGDPIPGDPEFTG